MVAAIYGFGFKPYTYTSTATALCEADVSSVGGTNEYSSYSYSVYLTNTFKDFITSQPVLDGAKEILDNFGSYIGSFKKIIPVDYQKIKSLIDENILKGLSREEAQINAFTDFIGGK